jgi:hypothetical protein
MFVALLILLGLLGEVDPGDLIGGGGDSFTPPDLTPVPDLPPEPPATPFPPIGPPLKYLVHGAEAAWSDVASWVSDQWHHATDSLHGADIAIYDGVKRIVDTALGFEQTAWTTFANTLESQLLANVSNIIATIDALTENLYNNVNALWDALSFADASIRGWALNGFHILEHLIAGAVNDAVAREQALSHNLQHWAIDNIYQPLEETIFHAVQQVYANLQWDVQALQNQITDINVNRLPRLGAELGAVAALAHALQTWVDECGEPMCVQMGPKTDWSKLLKVLNVAGMLALLTSVGALTEHQLEQLAATIASIGADPASAFVDAFVTEGDTLAAAIAGTIPAIAI